MTRLTRTVLAVAATLMVVAGAGCAEEPAAPVTAPSQSASTSPGPTLPPPAAACPEYADVGTPVRLTNSTGHSIAGVVMGPTSTGPGSAAVVLAHQSQGSLCEWLPYGRVLAAKGYRVLAFDFVGSGSSTMAKQPTYVEDVRTAVEYLRTEKIERVAVMGASMGATMSIVAAAAISPPVDAVLAISPPTTFDGVNAERAAPSLRSPALYLAGDTDGDYASYAESIYDATPGEAGVTRQLVVLKAAQHGIGILDAETQATVQARNAIEVFLATFAPLAR